MAAIHCRGRSGTGPVARSVAPTLGEFLRARRHSIVREWSAGMRRLVPESTLSERALIGHLSDIVCRIATALEPGDPPDDGSPHETHAIERLTAGFELHELVNEYAELRRCILSVWEREHPAPAFSDMQRLHGAIDGIVGAAAACYTEARVRRGIDAFVRELREEKRARDRAETRSVELDAVIEAIPEAVFVRDGAGITRANRAALELTGATRGADLSCNPALRVESPSDPAATNGFAHDVHVRAVPTGRHVVLRCASAPVVCEGERVGTVTVAANVTERRRDEEGLRFLAAARATLAESLETETTLAAIAELAVPTFADWATVHLVGPEGQIRPVAVAHADPARVTLAQRFQERYPPNPGDPVGLANVLRTGQPEWSSDVSDAEVVATARDEEHLRLLKELDIRSYIFIPLVARGRTLGALGFIVGKDARRFDTRDFELAKELGRTAAFAVDNARLYGEAQEAVRMRDQVLAIVTHDLRNPLSTIRCATTVLERMLPPEPPELQRAVDGLRRAAFRMRRLISDLLDMVSIRAGKLAVNCRPEDPEALVTATLEEHGASAREAGVSLVCRCTTGDVRVHSDRDRILQVFGNLIANAARFTPPGGTITVACALRGPDVQFSVTDTGPGIPEEERRGLFDAYVSAGDAAKRGTGLGLYIARGIVEGHGGRIWIEEGSAGGATFSFSLPAARRRDVHAGAS